MRQKLDLILYFWPIFSKFYFLVIGKILRLENFIFIVIDTQCKGNKVNFSSTTN